MAFFSTFGYEGYLIECCVVGRMSFLCGVIVCNQLNNVVVCGRAVVVNSDKSVTIYQPILFMYYKKCMNQYTNMFSE
jgi:hypothetical protein